MLTEDEKNEERELLLRTKYSLENSRIRNGILWVKDDGTEFFDDSFVERHNKLLAQIEERLNVL